MRVLKRIGIGVLVVVIALMAIVGGVFWYDTSQADETQAKLQPFYDLPSPLPDVPAGTILRSEPMSDLDWQLTGANAYRTLYMSAGPHGEPRVSSGMLFIPTAVSEEPRPVVTYAHGTAGFGQACAPSRMAGTPVAMPWVQTMMDNGWILTTTDYVGVGTTGTPYYLIGRSEANDVVNAVRVALNYPESGAGKRYTVMGHSQGGHAALWAGALGPQIAPELNLLGVSASAPAAELGPLVSASWDLPNAWALGPDILVSWPKAFPELNAADVTTEAGREKYEEFAYECIEDSLLEGQLIAKFGQALFSRDPSDLPEWKSRIEQETPKPYPASLPVQLHVGVGDGLVFPFTQAILEEKWCKAGSALQFDWMGVLATGFEGGVIAHGNTILFGWPTMTSWMQERFQGKPATSNCGISHPALPPPPEPESD